MSVTKTDFREPSDQDENRRLSSSEGDAIGEL